MKQSGAVEACWAHNPEVDRSKLSSAKSLLLLFLKSQLNQGLDPMRTSEAGFLKVVPELCTSYVRVSHQLQKMGFLKKSVLELGTR